MSSPLDTGLAALDRIWPWYVLLGTILLVVVAWRVLWRLQARHHEAEPRGKAKVVVAIALSLLVGFGGYYEIAKFQESAREGMHTTFVNHLNLTIGEGDYLELGGKTISKREFTLAVTIPNKLAEINGTIVALDVKILGLTNGMATAKDPVKQAANLASAQKSLDDNRTTLKETVDGLHQAQADLAAAHVIVRLLTPNHYLFKTIEPMLARHDDEAAHPLVLGALDDATVAATIPVGQEFQYVNLTVLEYDYTQAVALLATLQASIPGLRSALDEANATMADQNAVHDAAVAAAKPYGNTTNQSDAAILARHHLDLASMSLSDAKSAQGAALGNLTVALAGIKKTTAQIPQLEAGHAVYQAYHLKLAAGDLAGAAAYVKDPLPASDPRLRMSVLNPCKRDGDGFCNVGSDGLPIPGAIEHNYFDAHLVRQVPVAEAGPAAFEDQVKFNAQMEQELNWLVYPGITGLFLAPFAFVGGHILNKAFAASTSVGFRKYPGKAAGFFLLIMAGVGVLVTQLPHMAPPLDIFGLFAIPFGAWVLRDLSQRSVEGQIAL